MKGQKTILIILDGWGHGNKTKADCIYNAETPFIDSLYNKYPNAQLLTDGEHVGLPEGQMGNSEVGHLNIGAGRIVYQDLMKINKDIENNKISTNPSLIKAINKAKNIDPKISSIWFTKASIEMQKGNIEAAIESINKNIKLNTKAKE